MLDEVLWVVLPGAQVDLGKEPLGDQLQDFPGPVLPVLLVFILGVRNRSLEHLAIELAGHGDLGLEVLELDGGDQDTDAVRVPGGIVLAALVVDVDVYHFECRTKGQFLNSQRVYLAAEQDFRQRLEVLIQ